jgi:hypothetical protein
MRKHVDWKKLSPLMKVLVTLICIPIYAVAIPVFIIIFIPTFVTHPIRTIKILREPYPPQEKGVQ